MNQFMATQGLWEAQRALAAAERASELMEKRGDALTRALLDLLEKAERLRADVDRALFEAYAALRISEVSDTGAIEAAASVVPADGSLRLYYTSLMGIELPRLIEGEYVPGKKLYGLAYSSPYLDDAYFRFSAVKSLVTELAETEAAVFRLARAVKQARTRVNILKGAVVPEIRASVARESLLLDEVEREDFVRLRSSLSG